MIQTIASDKFQNFYDSALFTNIGMLTSVDELIADSINFIAGILNSWISPENHFEANARTVNEIYLACCAIGNCVFDSAQYAILYNIAFENPYSGGDAVYTAREMLDLMFDDYLTEPAARFMEKPQVYLSDKPEVIVKPNPAINKVTIEIISSAVELNWSYKINDILGNILLQKNNVTDFQDVVDLSTLSKGAYFIHINMTNGADDVKKLIIIK